MRIACLSLSSLDKDARVLRTANALVTAGHDVAVFARRPWPDGATFSGGQLPSPSAPNLLRLGLVTTQVPATVLPAAAHYLYWLPPARRQALSLALRFKPDAVICNEWSTLPIGAAVKRECGARVIYDSHEFATEELVGNPRWRLVLRRAVQAIERRHIGDADCVITVSDGLAAALMKLYHLRNRPIVVRNLPVYESVPFRPTGRSLTILFHGLIRSERGLEELIDSMPKWSFDGRVVIRGYGNSDYAASLKARAAARGVESRVSFDPALAPSRLIEAAATADIGYLALPRISRQYEHALPNKLFEYMMAGLAVCATICEDIAAIVRAKGTGFFTEIGAEPIAAALNQLSPATLDRMRRASLEASRSLNWEHEKQRLLDAVEGIAHSARDGDLKTTAHAEAETV
jgi:glycogen synthase